DRLCRILEPLIILVSRGRPRLTAEDILVILIPRGNNLRRGNAISWARNRSKWEREEKQRGGSNRGRGRGRPRGLRGRGRGRGNRGIL
ncbi:hypothetical protein ACRALDRAFT_1030865, partial [Sodiomyces alcalophilus JCM 7366]|uniref:uncharacterized protein n=1 Tax=Sodiomyces alcalophilus JCM 7366 TaxID=591952 RepID=UPI0039B43EAC